MSFSDLLKKPLPSKVAEEDTIIESAENDEVIATEGEETNIAGTIEKELDNMSDPDIKTEDSDEDDIDDVDVSDDLDDLDLSDLSDEELDEMEDDLRDSDLDDVVGDDIEPVELSPEEEREADDMMCLAGTTELIKSEMNAEERAAFLESAEETQIAVFEGFLFESDVNTDGESEDVMTEAKFYNKTTVRFSKEDRKAQLYAVALNVSARAHNDPDYIKLQKVQKIRRVLKRKIQRKYHAEAIRRMKVYFNRLRSSKSQVLSNLGKKISAEPKK